MRILVRKESRFNWVGGSGSVLFYKKDKIAPRKGKYEDVSLSEELDVFSEGMEAFSGASDKKCTVYFYGGHWIKRYRLYEYLLNTICMVNPYTMADF